MTMRLFINLPECNSAVTHCTGTDWKVGGPEILP